MSKVTLQIKRKALNLIKSGIKQNDWREPSMFNKKKLLAKNEDGKYTKNDSIDIIEFINGYSPTAERIQVECLGIIPVKFSTNIDIEEDDFKALEGTNSIRIMLGKIL